MIDPEIGDGPPPVNDKTLRQFAVLSVVILGGLAAWHGLVAHRVALASVLAIAGLYIGAAGLVSLAHVRTIYTILLAITFPIGQVVSTVLLAIVFYGVFVPVALWFKLIGRDALVLRRPQRSSHWEVKPSTNDLRSYMRQS